MDGPIKYYISEVNQKEKNKFYIISLIYEISYTKQKKTHRHRRQIYNYQRLEGGREGQIRYTGLTDKTTIHKTDKQQEFAVWHRELYSITYNNLQLNII